ncbi:MAG: ankyrin repeat domain-containing protein, partial [Phycisphaerales bacterium]
MESWLIRIADYLLAQSWQIAVLTIAVALATFALRNRSAHVRYLLWLIVLAKALVPPLYSIPVAVLPERAPPVSVPAPPMAERMVTEYRVPEAAVTESVRPALVQSQAASPRIMDKPAKYNPRSWLVIAWLAGAVALSFYYLLNALRTQIWLQRRREALPSESARSIERFFASHGIKRRPRVWMLERISQPFVWGLVRGSIYLPARLLDGKDPNFRASLLGHELSHVIRLDAMVNSLQVIAQTVFWFHPFMWWANAKIRAEREKCCDETTIARLKTLPEEYGGAIVEMLAARYEQARPVPSLAVAGQVKNIEERINTMLRPGKKFHRRPSMTVAIVMMLMALLSVPTALVLTTRAGTKAASTPLHQAAAAGNMREARSLISRGASVNAKDNEGRTPLFYAVENGHSLLCDLLIVKGADVNVKDEAGDTPLHHVARLVRHNDFRLAAELARRGADVNAANNQRQTPLHVALEGGSAHHIPFRLLRYDVNVNAKDVNGKTALHLAAQRAAESPEWGHVNVLSRICAKGADVNLTDSKGQAALHIACDYEGQVAIRTILTRATAVNVNVVDRNNVTPLHIAARRGQTDTCKTLINSGAAVNLRDEHGHTSVHHAVRAGNIETADWLIKQGADMSPVYLAAYRGNPSRIKTLLAGGASASEKDETGFTALHAAAAGGHRDVVEYLISQGADVKAEGGPGWTALSYAARGNAKEVVELLRAKGVGGGREVSRLLPVVIERGYREMVTILVALGADIDVNNGEPLTTAVRCGHNEIVELLISKGADVNAGEEVRVPLYTAAHLGRIDIAERLIDAGANINGLDTRNQGWPLEAAVDSEDMKMIEFLLSKGADVNKGGGWSPLHHAVH